LAEAYALEISLNSQRLFSQLLLVLPGCLSIPVLLGRDHAEVAGAKFPEPMQRW
jgi:hypothetical protein